jgi:transposase
VLCARGQMGAQSRALFQAMLVLFELLMAVFMEKHTVKDSTNSSKPSSQTPQDETAITHSFKNISHAGD